MKVKISIIIPVYNVEKYLRQCLDSVVNQTLKDIEIICVDDGSTDSSLEILKEYASKDDRISIVTQKNLHAGVARNKGMNLASGEYVHFLDSDDWIDENAYEKLYNDIKNNNADIAKFRAYSYNNQTGKITTRSYLDIKRVNKKYFGKCLNIIDDTVNTVNLPDSPWSGLYNLDFLKKNNIYFDDFICANDVGFFYRSIVNAKRIYLSSERFVYYRENQKNSLIAKRAENFHCQTALFDVIKPVSENLPPEIKQIVLNKVILSIFCWYNNCLFKYNISTQTEQNIKAEMKKFLEKISEENLTRKNLKYYIEIKNGLSNLAQKKSRIFSLTKTESYKIITILGMTLKFKMKNKDV